MKTEHLIGADNGRLYHVIIYHETGTRIEIPLNSDGTVRWYEDRMKTENGAE